MGKLTSILPALALGAAGAISTAAPSLADPVTYTMQFLGTGCVGDAAVTADCATNAPPTFTSATVTLTMENDTGNIMFDSSVTPPLYEINGTATVSISGVNGGAPATFADTMQFYTDSVSLVGVFDGSINPNPTPPPDFFGLDIVDQFSNGFSLYQLGTIAPTTGTVILGAGQPIPFSGFELTSATSLSSPAWVTPRPSPPPLRLPPSRLLRSGVASPSPWPVLAYCSAPIACDTGEPATPLPDGARRPRSRPVLRERLTRKVQ